MLRDFFRVSHSMAKDSYWFFTDLPSNGRKFDRIGGNAVMNISPLSLVGKHDPQGVRSDPSQETVRQAHDAAIRLEASFLAEMLKSTGFGSQQGSFSGGIGEEQFASFHREAIAQRMVEAGGIGLAEHFFRAIMETQDAT